MSAGQPYRLVDLRVDTLEEIQLYELLHGEAIGQAEFTGRLDVTQGGRYRSSSIRTT